MFVLVISKTKCLKIKNNLRNKKFIYKLVFSKNVAISIGGNKKKKSSTANQFLFCKSTLLLPNRLRNILRSFYDTDIGQFCLTVLISRLLSIADQNVGQEKKTAKISQSIVVKWLNLGCLSSKKRNLEKELRIEDTCSQFFWFSLDDWALLFFLFLPLLLCHRSL